MSCGLVTFTSTCVLKKYFFKVRSSYIKVVFRYGVFWPILAMFTVRIVQNSSVLQSIFRRISLANGDLRISNSHWNSLVLSNKILEQDKSCNWLARNR